MSKRHRRKKAPSPAYEPFATTNERGVLVGARDCEWRNKLPDAPLGKHEPERIHATVDGKGAIARIRRGE